MSTTQAREAAQRAIGCEVVELLAGSGTVDAKGYVTAPVGGTTISVHARVIAAAIEGTGAAEWLAKEHPAIIEAAEAAAA